MIAFLNVLCEVFYYFQSISHAFLYDKIIMDDFLSSLFSQFLRVIEIFNSVFKIFALFVGNFHKNLEKIP